MKNKILKTVLALMFGFCSIAMFACGGGGESKIDYQDLPQIITTIKDNKVIFKSGVVDNVSSNYIIKAFDKAEDKYFNDSLIIPMNYIEKYSSDIETIAKQNNLNGEQLDAITKLEISLSKMNYNYLDMNMEHERLTIFSENNESIYQGALQLFKYSVTDFISSTYEVAINFADVQNKVLGKFDGMINRKISVSDSEILRDYSALKIGQDYFNFLLVNCNSKQFTSDQNPVVNENVNIVQSIKNSFTSFVASYCGAKSFNDLSSAPVEGETEKYNNTAVENLIKVQNILDGERVIVGQALESFSMYNFFQTYNCNITAYENDNEHASQYRDEILVYYQVILTQHINALRTILIV